MARALVRTGFGGPTANTTAFDCSTATGVTVSVGTGGSVAFDPAMPSPRSTLGSLRMVQPTISSSFVQFTKDVSPVIPASQTRGIGLWVKVLDHETAPVPVSVSFGVYFGATPGDTSGGFATCVANFSGSRSGQWYFIAGERSKVTYGGGASATSWTTASVTRVIVQRYGTASEAPFWIGGIELCYAARPTLLLSFDGQYVSVRDYVAPLMATRGLVGTMFVSWDNLGSGRMTQSDLTALLAAGWDLGPRKFAQNNIGYDDASYTTAEQITTDILRAQRACVDAGGTVLGSRVQCIPQTNPWSAGNSYAIRQRCEQAFVDADVIAARLGSEVPSGVGNGMSTNQFDETGTIGHLQFVFSRQLHNTVTSAAALADVDEAIKLGSTMSHYMHQTAAAGSSGVWSEANTLAYLNGVEARVKAGLIDVVTWAEWLESSQGRAT